ncbi:MAG: dinitrogenase iron-molybdenum cofactor biosynthesis protein [Deltaproteobacteria bacterium]|jgi:predicted Fe-Mo cluster-binding NifX family protein|nr:dinitrogenase iron-molybdenum cofactor biosynthesis protein [Deltaproteobacteria bacterium]
MVNKYVKKPDKVAIASTDGQRVDACFGKVNEFRIFRATAKGYQLEEIRRGPEICHERSHDLTALNQTADLLSDCQLVLAGRIGPAAMDALTARGVTALACSLGLEEALTKLSS